MSLLLGVAGTGIQAGELYPWQLTRDSLLLFEGSTYRYTVDTPENEGLSSTLPSVEALKEQLVHSGSGIYRLFTSTGQEKTEGLPVNGDYLQSASKKRLLIGVRKGALPPVIKLDRTAFTIKTAGNLTLDFYAGQRSPMTTVTIRVPEGIAVTLDNTTVNVIGRGEVILRGQRQMCIRDRSFTSFYWTAPRNAESVTLLLSEDKGRTWKPVRTGILPDDDFAAAGRLNPNQLYAFKLLVK